MPKNYRISKRLIVFSILMVISFSGCSPRPSADATSEPIATSAPQEPTSQPTIQPTQTPTIAIVRSEPMTESELEETLTNELKGKLKGITYDYLDEPGTIYVMWEFFPDYSNQRISDAAKEDTATILRTFYFSGMDFDEIIVSGWFTETVDINNNVEYSEFLHLYYGREKVEGIKWDTLRVQYIWLIADYGEVHWVLEE